MLLLALTAQTCAAASPTPTPSTTPVAKPLSGVRAAAAILLRAINADRARHHVKPLALDRKESACSARHSRHMASADILSHDQFPRDVCVPRSYAAENVGVAEGDPVSAVLTLERMMMAEGPCRHHPCRPAEMEQHGHYLNLVNALYQRIGIGIAVADGQVWLTEDFIGSVPAQRASRHRAR